MKLLRLISILLALAVGISSTGFVSTRYVCSGKKSRGCDDCRTMKRARCCTLVTDYSKIDAVGKTATAPKNNLVVHSILIPASDYAPRVIPVNINGYRGPPREPSEIQVVRTTVLRL